MKNGTDRLIKQMGRLFGILLTIVSGIATAQEPAPEPFLITGVTANTVSLQWNDIYNNEDGFILIRSDAMGYSTSFFLASNITNYLDTNLVTGALYYYQITAYNSGGESAPAFTNAVPTPIAGPEPLIVTAVTANTVSLQWNDIYDNEDGFILSRWDSMGYGNTFFFGPNTTNYLDTNLVTGATYYYRVVAYNSGGESAPAFTSAVPTPIPGPEPLVVTSVTANTIGLQWNDIYDNEDGFILSRWDNMGYGNTFFFGPNTTNYLDTNLVTGATYYYRVVAYNSGGESAPAFTNAVPTPIAGPEPLIVTAVTANTISLQWNDIYDNEDGFILERSSNGETFEFVALVGSNVVTYVDANLSGNTLYFYHVAAVSSGGTSAYSTNVSATTLPNPPEAPSVLSVTDVSQTNVLLNWIDNSSDETAFELDRSTNGTTFIRIATLPSNTTIFNDFPLSPATAYYYRVRAANSGGTSIFSPVISATTLPYAPAAPSGLTTVAFSQTQIDLSWTDNANNEAGFRIERSLDGTNFIILTTLGPDTTSYSDTGLSAVTTYFYRVSSTNSGGISAASNISSATTRDYPPTAPSALAATVISASQINLVWSDNSGNETAFRIYISTDGVNFVALATVGANVTNHSVTGLNSASTYYFRVLAYNSEGDSGVSNVASATTLDVPPLAPTALAASGISSNRIDLSWTDNADNETGFQIERSTNGTSFATIATVAANTTNYSNTGLTPSTTYYYRVRAINSAGTSDYSNTTNATTGAVAPPAAPTGLALVVVSSSQINLQWNDNSSNETQFLIERSLNGSTFTQIGTVGANVRNYSATGLAANTRYYFRVRATNNMGNSSYSNTANAKTSR